MRLLLTLVIVGVLPFLVRAVKNRRINCILMICYTIAVLIITLGSRSFENETHVGWNPIAVYQRAIQSVRILASWCENHKELFHNTADILYFAPEYSMTRWMKRNHVSYTTADLYKDADLNWTFKIQSFRTNPMM